jgi:hypothetical protein
MGPKNRFIQEIVFSDDYDGYIADVIPTTSYKDITTLQNLFVLSRLVNTKFIQILFPTGNVDDDTGNESQDGTQNPFPERYLPFLKPNKEPYGQRDH